MFTGVLACLRFIVECWVSVALLLASGSSFGGCFWCFKHWWAEGEEI